MTMDHRPASDTWDRGDPYEQYVGRWSRRVAALFLSWLRIPAGRRWLDVGCGTGALCAAIADHCSPSALAGVEPSEGFLETARGQLAGRAAHRHAERRVDRVDRSGLGDSRHHCRIGDSPGGGGMKMSALTVFLEQIPAEQQALVRSLHAVISKAAPTLAASLKWGNLTYHAKKNVCALVSHKDHVNLQVWGGASLKDPSGSLVGTGKDMRHIKVATEADIDPKVIAELVQQAARLAGA